jgi:anthranilate synthase component 2
VRHRTLSVEGVQFHPESILTPEGPKIMETFLHLAPRPAVGS